MRRHHRLVAAFAAVAIAFVGPAAAQETRKLPYWASLAASDALMRTGPGRNYPSTWRYQRVGLPFKVIALHESWRRVREVDGTEGWMASALLTEQRTGLVTGGIRELRAAPDAASAILWRAQPGVIGKLSHCGGGWCALDIKGRKGFIRAEEMWGIDAGETVE